MSTMSPPEIGRPLPDFELPATGGTSIRLSDLKGKSVVLYFYPKDSTPGCTLESRDFRDRLPELTRANAVVLGVSRDGMRSHERFKGAECLPFELLSDEDESLCRRFGVLKEKNLYGRKVMGIERSTFLIDGGGVLRREWRKVKVEGHAAEVLDAVLAL
jgi:peroxiredoxin Q/BCP